MTYSNDKTKLIALIEPNIKRAKKTLKELDRSLTEEERSEVVTTISGKCLETLDHIASFVLSPTYKGKIYFPRFLRISDLKKQLVRYSVQIDTKEYKFFINAHQLIRKNQFAICYIDAAWKHSTSAKTTSSYAKLAYKGEINRPELIKRDESGLSIGNFIKITKGGSARIQNTTFSDQFGLAANIVKLEYKTIKVSGKFIIFESGQKKLLKPWLEKCIKTCEEIIEIIS